LPYTTLSRSTATLLTNGNVLVTGGHRGRRADITIHASSELYDPRRGAFSPAGDLTLKRQNPDAPIVPGGRVLVVGGTDERDGRNGSAYREAEIFDPAARAFTPASLMN